MTAVLHSLPTPAKEAEKSVLDLLGWLLKDAETGNVESIFVVSYLRNGRIEFKHSTLSHLSEKIGLLERMKHELMQS